MSKRWFQSFSFKTNRYDRPNQKWICARAGLGEPCLAGPDQNGQCRATFECRPLRKGDRWGCTRPEAGGGPCAAGPLPDGTCTCPIPRCQPVRSLRSWRGLVTVTVVAFTLGALALVLTSHRGRDLVSPGELSTVHASSQSDCSDCHQNVEGSPVNWLTFERAAARSEDRTLCLKCHDLGAQPFHAHGKAPPELAEVTRRLVGSSPPESPADFLMRASATLAGLGHVPTELNCAVCHREHRGKKHDLKSISDRQCQTCHARQFASFANGHPEFGAYPFQRRTRLIFDHFSHLRQHFREPQFEAAVPTSCGACHAADSLGRTMLVKAFEETCAACHDDQIRGKGRADSPGIAFLRLPGLDAESLRDKDLQIGAWPEFAEGKLTPFMELMLAGEPGIEATLEQLEKVDLLDLADAGQDVLAAAHTLAWAVKGLLSDLSAKGQDEVARRLQTAMKTRLKPAEIGDLASLLSPDAVESAIANWFPQLEAELTAFRERRKIPEPLHAETGATGKRKGVKPEDWVKAGGWYRSDLDYALLYRPGGHADRFLTSWLNLTVDATRFQSAKPAQTIFSELSGPKASGYCMKCHSVDLQLVNWHGARPNPREQKFTKFSHASHFSLLDDRGCLTCHQFNSGAAPEAYAAGFAKANRDVLAYASNFKPANQHVCASCHTSRLAGDSCLMCHNYHVGELAPRLPTASEFDRVSNSHRPAAKK